MKNGETFYGRYTALNTSLTNMNSQKMPPLETIAKETPVYSVPLNWKIWII